MKQFEQFYKLTNAQVMLIETDLEGNIVKVNANYEKFYSFTQEELIKGGFKLIRHPKVSTDF